MPDDNGYVKVKTEYGETLTLLFKSMTIESENGGARFKRSAQFEVEVNMEVRKK